MDIATIIGLVIGLLGLIGGYIMDGGHIGSLIIPSAMIIVFGGTFGTVFVAFKMSDLKQLPAALKMAFFENKVDSMAIVNELVSMTRIARKEGILALEQKINENENQFLNEGILMVIDGTNPDVIRTIMELQIGSFEHKCEIQAKMFEAAGGYAPTMGIIGTVMGLIHVLGNLSDPNSLGPAIAVAFTATLYGVMSANVLYLPIATKIKNRIKEKVTEMELVVEGIISLQAGENPNLLHKKLMSFLNQHQNEKKIKTEGEQ